MAPLPTKSPAPPASTGLLVAFGLALLGSCTVTHGLFSSPPTTDRSRPVARIVTVGGAELAATTAAGILFLGRTAQDGPCQVHYLLGSTPIIEDGEIQYRGGVFYEAVMDLKHQNAPVLDRSLAPGDEIVAMVMDGFSVDEHWTRLAADPDVVGDVLVWSGSVPAGSPLFVIEDDRPHFVGIVTGALTYTPAANTAPRRFLAFAGLDRLRETWLVPERFPRQREIIHRGDDITIIK